MRGRAFRISTGAALLSLALVGTAAPQAEDVEPFKLADAQLEPVKWSDLPGWTADDHLAAFAAFQVSCRPFRSAKRPRDTRPVYLALVDVCRRAAGLRPSKARQRARVGGAVAADHQQAGIRPGRPYPARDVVGEARQVRADPLTVLRPRVGVRGVRPADVVEAVQAHLGVHTEEPS